MYDPPLLQVDPGKECYTFAQIHSCLTGEKLPERANITESPEPEARIKENAQVTSLGIVAMPHVWTVREEDLVKHSAAVIAGKLRNNLSCVEYY